MLLQIYLNQIKALVEQYAIADFVLKAEATIEPRREEQSYLAGSVVFQDESTLYFKEYLDFFDGKLDKLMYSYHYQNAAGNLIFRYDNAAHKPALGFAEHKHLPAEIISAPAPIIEDVLAEIVLLNDW